MAKKSDERRSYPVNINFFVDKCRNIDSAGLRVNLKSENPTPDGGVWFRILHGMSAASYGEKITVTLTPTPSGTDVHVQNYQLSFSFSGEPSNPVEARQIKIDGLEERIKKLERYTQPITQLIADLNAPENLKHSENKMLLDILKLLYFGKNTVEDVLYEMSIGRRTFTRKRRQLVLMALGYLAL